MSFGQNLLEPWIVLGDFNTYLAENDKLGGIPLKNSDIVDFVQCVSQLELMDLHSVGCYYTWYNGTVRSKLDRVLVNGSWLLSDIAAFTEFLAPGCVSDHSCYMVSINSAQNSFTKRFKFLNTWVLHSNFLSLVRQNWSTYIDGHKQFVLKQKITRLKKPLTRLNDKHFSHISVRTKRANDELEMEQNILLTGGNSTKDIKSIRSRAAFLMEAEKLFFEQKARCDFVKFGDRCSKFFYSLMKRNNKQNCIVALTKSDGRVTNDGEEIASEFVNYYKSLLGNTVMRNRLNRGKLGEGKSLSPEQQHLLVTNVMDDEIKNALFDIDDGKLPGPDGYGSLFFKNAWSVVGTDVVHAVKEFFNTGMMLKEWNHALIALVPKSNHSNLVTDYRPMSCCNVFYKIISKILASRLRSVIGDIVDPAQSAFIKDRSIVDNIHLAQELFRKYRRKNSSARCILKVDLQKAYDTIHWSFLREAMQHLNFPGSFIRWIMECVSTTSYSLSINGQTHGFFGGKRGLQQGDPLSPYLFTMCLEMLSRSLKCAAESPDFNFHPKCKPLGITHIAYADDLLLLSRGDVGSVNILVRCLKEFGETAGLKVNVFKSSMFLAGVSDGEKADLLQQTGFQEGVFPFRYLGIPMASSKLNMADYSPLLDALSMKINSWPKQTLSYAGKLELIKSVLQGTQCFWLSAIPFPAGVISRIYALCRNFFWSSKHAAISWKLICLPRESGGLGLRNLKLWNKALLCKLLWKIQSKKDSLWIKWIHHFYFNDIWSYTPRRDDSTLIKALIQLRNELSD